MVGMSLQFSIIFFPIEGNSGLSDSVLAIAGLPGCFLLSLSINCYICGLVLKYFLIPLFLHDPNEETWRTCQILLRILL